MLPAEIRMFMRIKGTVIDPDLKSVGLRIQGYDSQKNKKCKANGSNKEYFHIKVMLIYGKIKFLNLKIQSTLLNKKKLSLF